MDLKFIETSTKKPTSSELPARAAHLSTFRPLGCGQVRPKMGVLIFLVRFWASPDFRGAPPGPAPLKIKNDEKRRQESERPASLRFGLRKEPDLGIDLGGFWDGFRIIF